MKCADSSLHVAAGVSALLWPACFHERHIVSSRGYARSLGRDSRGSECLTCHNQQHIGNVIQGSSSSPAEAHAAGPESNSGLTAPAPGMALPSCAMVRAALAPPLGWWCFTTLWQWESSKESRADYCLKAMPLNLQFYQDEAQRQSNCHFLLQVYTEHKLVM